MKIVFFQLLSFCCILTAAAQGKHIKVDNFESQFVQPRNIEIWLPDEYEKNPDKKFAVLYMHDGQNVFSRETAMGKTPWAADSIAAKLISEKRIEPIIIVAAWNSNKRYVEYFPEKAENYFSKEERKKLEDLAKYMGLPAMDFLGDEYLKFMVTELKPYIDKNYNTLTDVNNTAVCGSSMGGLISMYAICEYPDVFGKAACVSTHWPILFDNSNMAPSEAVRQYMREHLPQPQNHRIYYDYGTKTLDAFYEVHQDMVDDIMVEKGYTQDENWLTKKYEGAEHNEISWRKRLDVILEFLYKK